MIRCSWCGHAVLSPEPPRCRKCNAILCSPDLRDCAFVHWKITHERRVEEVKSL